MKLPSHIRFKLLDAVRSKQKSVSQICKEYNVSRKTYYKWRKRYLQSDEVDLLERLKDRQWQLKRHGKRLELGIEQQVLNQVSNNPESGYEGIRRLLLKKHNIRSLSKHAVQNVLKRFYLQDRLSRINYAQAKKRRQT